MSKRINEPPTLLAEKKVRLSLWNELTQDLHHQEQEKLKKRQEVVTRVQQLVSHANTIEKSERLQAIQSQLGDELKGIHDQLEYFKNLPVERVLAWFRSKAPAGYLVPLTDYQRRVNRVAKIMTSFNEATPEDKLFAREWFKEDPEVLEMISAWERKLY